MGQLKLTGALLLSTLFTIAIIGFAVNFARTNDVAININDDPSITGAKGSSSSNIQVFKRGVEGTSSVLQNSTITGDKDTLERTGQFEGGGTGSFNAVKNILNMTRTNIFGGEQGNSGLGIFLVALVGFIALSMTLYLWKTLGGKNPD